MRMPPDSSSVPLRNAIDEICPSPHARKLRIKRVAHLATPRWSGCRTIEGLKRATDSSEYSLVK